MINIILPLSAVVFQENSFQFGGDILFCTDHKMDREKTNEIGE
jgi:hypothetical protein